MEFNFFTLYPDHSWRFELEISRFSRFFIIDLNSGRDELSTFVAHDTVIHKIYALCKTH